MSGSEKNPFLPSGSGLSKPRERRRSSSSEWSDEGGSYSSIYSRSNSNDSFVNEWEAYVSEDKRLFYIEFSSNVNNKIEKNENSLLAAKNQFSRASTRRSNKGSKLSRFVGKSGGKAASGHTSNPTPSVTFSESAEGAIKEIAIWIDPANRHRFGRRSTVCEAILGLSICPFPDGNRMMIANFMPNFDIVSEDKTLIKVGDWLKSINNVEVNAANVDEILTSFEFQCEIRLKLQRTSEEEPIQPESSLISKILSLSNLLETFEAFHEDSEIVDFPMIFGLMYLTMEGLDEQGPEGQDVLYCFPPKSQNVLYSSRGSFLTLNSILKSAFNSTAKITSVKCGSNIFNISYTIFNEDVLLIAIREDFGTPEELQFKTNEIIRLFEFINRNISENFYPQNHEEMTVFCKMLELSFRKDIRPPMFEKALLETHFVPLPKEAQLRIDDALSEMEAMDYREWNDEPLKSHREFFIIGSALYYKSYLLASHLPPVDLRDIEAFLRLNAIVKILEIHNVKDLIVWREVFPSSCEIRNTKSPTPQGRWFLAVVARSQMIICTLLEHRDDKTHNNLEKIGPSPFYIEEIQDTLDHLKTGGIELLASTWTKDNRRPQIIRGEAQPVLPPNPPNKKTEIISILKRRKDSTEHVGSSSVHSQTVSEDSERKYDDDEQESDSDWDGFPDSQRSSSGYDMSEMTETLLREVSDLIPTKITAGIENVLFHYVHLEIGEAYLLAPTNIIDNQIIKSFRQACLLIHTVLQNTLKFRQLLSEDGNKPNSHRSLVAIKEHGILISIRNEKGEIVEFWAIGRLFSSPVRELYVCHRSDIPQNLVEIAFRLSLHVAG